MEEVTAAAQAAWQSSGHCTEAHKASDVAVDEGAAGDEGGHVAEVTAGAHAAWQSSGHCYKSTEACDGAIDEE